MGSEKGPDEELPPLFRSWRGMYALVLGGLVVTVVVFAILTRLYR